MKEAREGRRGRYLVKEALAGEDGAQRARRTNKACARGCAEAQKVTVGGRRVCGRPGATLESLFDVCSRTATSMQVPYVGARSRSMKRLRWRKGMKRRPSKLAHARAQSAPAVEHTYAACYAPSRNTTAALTRREELLPSDQEVQRNQSDRD